LCTSGFTEYVKFSRNGEYTAEPSTRSAYLCEIDSGDTGAALFDFVVVHTDSKLHTGRGAKSAIYDCFVCSV